MPTPPLPGGPIPPETNPPINPQYYLPRFYQISNITLGKTTTITTTVDHDYVVTQQIRLLIPELYGSSQLNGDVGYVISIPSPTQVVVSIDSSIGVNQFIQSPTTITITGASKSNPAVLTATGNLVKGQYILISGVGGMTELNGQTVLIKSSNATTVTINLNSTGYTTYTSGGIGTLVPTNSAIPLIVAIGDINSGPSNIARTNNQTYISGSFINISPL